VARQQTELEPAFLLAQRPYRETSALLEVLSQNHGRVGLVARGARGPKARQRGSIALFRPVLISWIDGGELGTMTAIEAAGPDIVLDGERIFHGWYVNELLLKLLQRHDPHEDLYSNYVETLGLLQGSSIEAETALRRFEKRLLEGLGYALPLDQDFDEGAAYRYRPGVGFEACLRQDEEGSYRGAALIALRDEVWPARELLRESRRLLRAALAVQLGGRALETPKLLRSMRQLGNSQD